MISNIRHVHNFLVNKRFLQIRPNFINKYDFLRCDIRYEIKGFGKFEKLNRIANVFSSLRSKKRIGLFPYKLRCASTELVRNM